MERSQETNLQRQSRAAGRPDSSSESVVQAKGVAPPAFRMTANPIQKKESDSEEQTSKEQAMLGKEINSVAPPPINPLFQAKYTLGAPDDHYEREADSVAEKVVSQINTPQVQQKEEDTEAIQTKLETPTITSLQRSGSGGEGTVSDEISSNIESSRGGGTSMPADVQAKMGDAMGADFSGVRIHNNSNADTLNRSVNARAFTTGQDIFFKQNEYNPSSSDGQKLLAHELTHVVQQNSGVVSRKVIQRFESHEHEQIGTAGSNGARGETQMVELAPGYRVTFGEMVAMGGDFFTNIEEMRRIAANVGTGAGTREEIEYVRQVKVPHYTPAQITALEANFSESAMHAANERYYRLAANNPSHFVNPNGVSGTMSRALQGNPTGAVSNYRDRHRQAVEEAYNAGKQNKSIDTAMASEAFSNHFLTDSFSAGHLRTERGSISDYWNAKVPMFFHNFKGFMAEKIAKYINDNNTALGILTVDFLNGQALGTLESKLIEKGMPAVQFGDLVSGAIHDYDNQRGVRASVDGKEARLFGDGHLGQGDTLPLATQAVQTSIGDIRTAWDMGKANNTEQDLTTRLVSGGRFAAERFVPQALANDSVSQEDQSVKWDFNTAFELLSDSKFQQGLFIFLHEKKNELGSIGEGLSAEYKRVAFRETITNHLEGMEGVNLINQVINWTPNTGGGVFGHNQDDNAIDYFEEAKKTSGGLASLTPVQRINLIRPILDGYTSGSDEDKVLEILTSCPSDAEVRNVITSVGWGELEDELGDKFSNRYPRATYGH
jgi:Domain of unknown function (DUF4157)